MEASELRIGNLFDGMGMIQIVFEILDNTDRGRIIQKGYEHLILCKENGNQYKPIEINTIPLTEEWLLKFGFEKLEHIQLGVLYLKSQLRIKPSFMFAQWRGASVGKIDYVHQLQNLYFALCGEELEIK